KYTLNSNEKCLKVIDMFRTPSSSKGAKKWYKDWYKEQCKFWGSKSEIVWKKWASENKDACDKFRQQFLKILRKASPEQIPKPQS
ncbi:MAG: hypothetical protein AAB035_03070, partial [Nitrospirota bacterium]